MTFRFALIALLVVAIVAPALGHADSGEPNAACFYLDISKLKDSLRPVELFATPNISGTPSLRLTDPGLMAGNQQLCQWSLNGGSGSRERFELDGGEAVPILVESCERPFTHVYTGIGFGDWYLTLCGETSQPGILTIEFDSRLLYLTNDSLSQWTQYPPGAFPIRGDCCC